jgi:uracil-DNA glycosylase family 4
MFDPLNSLLDGAVAQAPPTEVRVPNVFPTMAAPYRIAIIGEAPGKDEVDQLQPFVGPSGNLLNSLLNLAGLSRQAVFVGNICQYRPPDNDISVFKWDSHQITEGIAQLTRDLHDFNPNLCVLLGATALRWAKGTEASIKYWRGSCFRSLLGYKCMATYHPAYIMRTWEDLQVLALDLRRAAVEGRTPDLDLPERTLLIPDDSSFGVQLITYLEGILRDKPKISIDIEGGVQGMSCLSIARSATESMILPFTGHEGTSYWDDLNEELVWLLFSKICSDPGITKVFQNGLYDLFVLAYTYKLVVVGPIEDTMPKHWEAYCELPKGLGFLASIYTKQPPWKDDRKTPDLKTFWRYCCIDSAVTLEINERLDSELTDPASLGHYHFNINMQRPLLYMELRGIRYDTPGAFARKSAIDQEIEQLNGRMEQLCGRPMNTNSPKFTSYIYDELGLPEVKNRQTGNRTANYEALLTLAKKTDLPVLHTAIKLRSLRTHSGMLSIHADEDGRIRCGYNGVGSETGRVTCYTSPTGSGYNLQTIPEYDRDLFLADEGYYFFQCDLAGADAWTVAAHCARLGDTTMLDDMRSGIKVAKVVTGMFRNGPEISRLERTALRDRTEGVSKTDPVYFGSKCCQHGTNYGMGKVLLSQTIFIQSEGLVNITAADAERLQNLYLMRYYGVRMWHRWCEQELLTKGRLTSASGHTRIFYGRRKEHSTLKAFLAHEPQANTTYATNLAALRLWTDPQNRWGYWRNRSDIEPACADLVRLSEQRHPDALVIEPLHQVHDALCGQFPKEVAQWATPKIREYFNNPLKIAGQDILIPFEGGYGDSWGNLKAGKV